MVSASAVASAEWFDTPMARTLPARTSRSSAASVSSCGMVGSGQCDWYRSITSV
jgi:hypothetical protein